MHGGLVGILCLMLAVDWDVTVLLIAPHVLIAYMAEVKCSITSNKCDQLEEYQLP